MTTHNYKVLKNYPIQFTVKSPRHWWQTVSTAYGEDTTVDVELVPFETLEHTFTNPLITFPRQTLLDGTILEEHTKILAESGREWTYGDGVTNINVIGTLTEDNGVYSGFAAGNCLQFPMSFNFLSGADWEMRAKVTTGTDLSTAQYILTEHGVSYSSGISLSGGHFIADIASANTSSGRKTLALSETATSVQPNTTYWVKLTYSNQKYTLYSSTDGVVWNEEGALSTTILPLSATWNIGSCEKNKYQYPFFGAIDLKECCFIYDGKIVWDYNNTKYYRGCLRSMMDVPNERTYNVDIVDGEVVLTTGNNQGLWGGQITIPAHDVVISYFPPVSPIE